MRKFDLLEDLQRHPNHRVPFIFLLALTAWSGIGTFAFTLWMLLR